MVFGKIQSVEVVALGLDLGAHRAREAELVEDLADLVHDLRDEVQPPRPAGAAGHREIDARHAPPRLASALELALPGRERRLEVALQGVGGAADLLAGRERELKRAGDRKSTRLNSSH